MIRFQKHHGTRTNRGIVKAGTWKHLQPYFDGYDVPRQHLHVSPPITDQVSKMLVAWWYYGNAPHHYQEGR